MRYNNGTAIPVYGVMQLFVDLLHAVHYGFTFTLCEGAVASASGGVAVDVMFQRRIAEQIGVEEYSGTSGLLHTFFKRFAGNR